MVHLVHMFVDKLFFKSATSIVLVKIFNPKLNILKRRVQPEQIGGNHIIESETQLK